MLVGCPALAVLLRSTFALMICCLRNISSSSSSKSGNSGGGTASSSNGSHGPRLGPSLVLTVLAIAVGVKVLPLSKEEQKNNVKKGKPSRTSASSPTVIMEGMLPEFAIDSAPLAEYFAMRGPVALLRQRGNEWANDGTKLIAMGGECAGLYGRRRLLPGYGRDLRYIYVYTYLFMYEEVACLLVVWIDERCFFLLNNP